MEKLTPTTENTTELLERIAKLEALVSFYEQQLLNAKRRQFGSSIEKTDIDLGQLNLFGNETVAPPPEPETEITYRRKKSAGKRDEDLSTFRWNALIMSFLRPRGLVLHAVKRCVISASRFAASSN